MASLTAEPSGQSVTLHPDQSVSALFIFSADQRRSPERANKARHRHQCCPYESKHLIQAANLNNIVEARPDSGTRAVRARGVVVNLRSVRPTHTEQDGSHHEQGKGDPPLASKLTPAYRITTYPTQLKGCQSLRRWDDPTCPRYVRLRTPTSACRPTRGRASTHRRNSSVVSRTGSLRMSARHQPAISTSHRMKGGPVPTEANSTFSCRSLGATTLQSSDGSRPTRNSSTVQVGNRSYVGCASTAPTLGTGRLLDGRNPRCLVVSLADETPAGWVLWRDLGMFGRKGWAWEIGILLAPEYRGRGVGTTAQMLLTEYLFDTTVVHRLCAITELDNQAEQRSLEKVGFRREGVLKQAAFRGGAWRDCVIYACLRDDRRRSMSPAAFT